MYLFSASGALVVFPAGCLTISDSPVFFSPQLKAVHEQLTALSQGPIIKPKKKKEKKDKKKKKKVEKEKHRRIEDQPKAPKITKAPKSKSTRAAGCPVLPIKKAPSKKNSKSK